MSKFLYVLSIILIVIAGFCILGCFGTIGEDECLPLLFVSLGLASSSLTFYCLSVFLEAASIYIERNSLDAVEELNKKQAE